MIDKMKILLLLSLLFFSAVNAQPDSTEKKATVMLLGTFHFTYPNLDVIKVEKKDQLDVLDEKRQAEIQKMVTGLAAFKPTVVAIEYKTWKQSMIDSQYNAYLQGTFELPRDEAYQIGFRLAKLSGLTKVHCIDAWGNIDYFYQTTDQKNYTVNPARKKVMEAFDVFEDSLLKAGALKNVFHDDKSKSAYQTIGDLFRDMNQPAKLKWDHSQYLKERFRFEYESYDYTGSDWLALSWYSRNLRIFRNIQRITSSPNDRLFVLFGSGHAYLLNQFCNESPDHLTISPLKYLQ